MKINMNIIIKLNTIQITTIRLKKKFRRLCLNDTQKEEMNFPEGK